MVEIYIIIAISFAIMFAFRYTRDIIFMVKGVAVIHEIDERPQLLNGISVLLTLFSLIFFPFYAILVLFSNRDKLIKEWSKQILVKYYDLELKNSC